MDSLACLLVRCLFLGKGGGGGGGFDRTLCAFCYWTYFHVPVTASSSPPSLPRQARTPPPRIVARHVCMRACVLSSLSGHPRIAVDRGGWMTSAHAKARVRETKKCEGLAADGMGKAWGSRAGSSATTHVTHHWAEVTWAAAVGFVVVTSKGQHRKT